MTEIVVTSSALILALLALRRLFRQKISRRVQYALWALVLVRLLVPVSLPAAEFSLVRAAAPAIREVENTVLYLQPVQEDIWTADGFYQNYSTSASQHRAALGAASTGGTRTITDENNITHQIRYDRQIRAGDLLRPVWYAGMAVMACWLAVTNLRFWRRLRRSRIPLELEGHRVYLVEEGLISPCLFGLFRPAIYLTPAALETEERTRHVIAHESTHARHLDPLWALLRGVCLTVYWFNPLVWWAAAASRADCELACDEGALRRLGEDARLAYGQTLLGLIPVQRAGGSPLLTATTMTADKKRLTERITRIAENRRTRWTALGALAVLAIVVCAVTFTGGGSKKTRLTAGELAWFNEYFFAGSQQESAAQRFLNAQYDSPEQIDLSGLFYFDSSLSGTAVSEEEKEALRQEGVKDPSEAEELVKISAARMDEVLRQYTGLGLEDMEGVERVRSLTCLPAYDACYFTRYVYDQPIPGRTMRAGDRQGDLVRLYYTYDESSFYETWYCVTLEDRGDNQYWFVSNQACREEIPAIPTVYPDTPGPVTVIPLDRAAPCRAPEAEPVQRLEVMHIITGGALQERRIAICSGTDGSDYLARYDQDEMPSMATCFARIPDGANTTLVPFYNLFGCEEGVSISYRVQEDNYGTTYTDYYAMDGDGNLTPLLRARGRGQLIDLDGDGDYELASSDGWRYADLFFQRGETVYYADLSELLPKSWPEAGYMEFGRWDRNRRCLPLWGGVVLPGHEDLSTGQATAFRDLYFDGENLVVYKSERAPALDLPAYVDEAASAIAQDRMAWFQKNTGVTGGDGSPVGEPAEWDAWRITQAKKVNSASFGDLPEGLEVEVYDFAYELHTTTPEKVILAGGTYLDEDGWVGGFYEEERYLVFWRNPATGAFQRLESEIAPDRDPDPGSAFFRAGLLWTLVRGRAMELADLSAEDLFDKLQDAPMDVLEDLASYSAAERDAALEKLMTHPKIAAYLTEMAGWDTSWFSDSALETWELLRKMPLG